MLSNCRGMVVAFAAGILLAACGDAPSDDGGSVATTNKPVPRAHADLPPEMVAAVSAGSSAAAISVHFALQAPPVVNNPLPVDIAIVPHREFATVRAHFETHEGLTLSAGETLEPVKPKKIEDIVKHQLVLLPTHDGVYMITVSVETEGDDGTITRVFSIPVIVSPAGAAASAASATPAAASPPPAEK